VRSCDSLQNLEGSNHITVTAEPSRQIVYMGRLYQF